MSTHEVVPLPYDGPMVWSNAKITNHWDLVFQYENKPLCWVKDGEVTFADDFTEEKLEELGGEDGNRGVAILFLEVYRLRRRTRFVASFLEIYKTFDRSENGPPRSPGP